MSIDVNGSELWKEILDDLGIAAEKTADYLKTHDGIDITPEITQKAIIYWERIIPYLLDDGGRGLREVIGIITDAYFPLVDDFGEAFRRIYENFFAESSDSGNSLLEKIQKETIREFINFMIAPDTKKTFAETEKQLLAKMIELFKNSSYLIITEDGIKALRRSSSQQLDSRILKMIRYLHLEESVITIRGARSGTSGKMTVYMLPREVMDFLVEKGVIAPISGDTEDETDGEEVPAAEGLTKYKIINYNVFNIDLFYAIILAHIASVERNIANPYIKAGIICQVALLFLLGTQMNVNKEIEAVNAGTFLNRLKENGFDGSSMQIIPKSWMQEPVVDIYLVLLLKAIGYIIGGPSWVPADHNLGKYRKLFKEMLTRMPKINVWMLGQKVRIQIPILVRIERLVAEVTGGLTEVE